MARLGMRKFVRRPRKAAPRRKQSSLVSLIKKVALNSELKHLETKYVAQTQEDNQPIPNNIISGTTSANLLPIIPATAQGNESFQRIGTRIMPTRLNVTAQVDFDPEFLENFDGWVRYYFVTSKKVKSQDLVIELPKDTFLDGGNGSSVDWLPVTPSVSAMYPVKNETWTVLKTHTFRVSKNVEKTTGSATNPYSTNIGHSSHLKNFSLKIPKHLVYDDASTSQIPTNHAIFLATVWWASDSTQYEGNVLRHTIHSHMYFKDA